MSIGVRLKTARKMKELSQDELARLIGVSRGVITNIEYDKVGKPQPLIIDAIVKILDINRDWLVSGNGEMNNITDKSESSKILEELYNVAKSLSEDECLYLLDTIKAMKARLSSKSACSC